MKWLFKTEPSEYSFDQLVRDKKTRWDGVTNALAVKHLRGVRKGDDVLIYHTGNVKAVVGLAQCIDDAYPPTIQAVKPVEGLTLQSVKNDPKFKNFELVRIGRLSVMPIPDELWAPLARAS